MSYNCSYNAYHQWFGLLCGNKNHSDKIYKLMPCFFPHYLSDEFIGGKHELIISSSSADSVLSTLEELSVSFCVCSSS